MRGFLITVKFMQTCPMAALVAVLIASLVGAAGASEGAAGVGTRINIIVPGDEKTALTETALARLKDLDFVQVNVVADRAPRDQDADLVVVLGVKQSPRLSGAKDDSYAITTVSTAPLTVVASGVNERGMPSHQFTRQIPLAEREDGDEIHRRRHSRTAAACGAG